MFTTIYSCLPKPCLFVFTDVYPCLLVFTYVYPHLLVIIIIIIFIIVSQEYQKTISSSPEGMAGTSPNTQKTKKS